MHLRQKENYGCGVYSIANALQCEDFVTNEKLELSINGNNVGQLGAWLYEYRIQCFLSCVIYNNEEVIDIFDLNPTFIEDCENQWVPFFITIKTFIFFYLMFLVKLSNRFAKSSLTFTNGKRTVFSDNPLALKTSFIPPGFPCSKIISIESAKR